MIPNESSVRSPVLMLACAACVVGFGTVRLAAARPDAPTPEPEPVLQSVEVMPEVPLAGIVASGHPVLPARFAGLEDEILASPMLYHPPFAAQVDRWVERWSVTFSDWMPEYLERMTGFEEMVDTALSGHDLPWSLRYLPVIESGYSPTAVSSASAVGMWQFMAPTARELGVEVNSLVDDRRDPFVSTGAAAEYLVALRAEFGSWFLALAAYNAGPDRIHGLLDRYLPDVEPSDAVYWALRDVLPRETAEFVPNFVAAAIVASDPEAYGYPAPRRAPFEFETVPVLGSVSFATIARATGTSTEVIARLNPEYLRGVTPPSRQVELRLPPGTATAFRGYFTSVDDR